MIYHFMNQKFNEFHFAIDESFEIVKDALITTRYNERKAFCLAKSIDKHFVVLQKQDNNVL